MSFWKYLLANTKLWFAFVIFAELFCVLAEWFSPLGQASWWGIETGLSSISLIILLGDYILWKRLKKRN